MLKMKNKAEKRKAQRRKAQRLETSLQVSYKLQGKSQSWKWVAYKDISGMGLGLLTNEPLKIDDKIDVLVNLGKELKPVNILCRVAWCSKLKQGAYRVGLEFLKTKSDIRLMEFVCDKILDLSLKE